MDGHLRPRVSGIKYHCIRIWSCYRSIFIQPNTTDVRRTGMFLARTQLLERPDHIFRGHLSVSLVELDSLVQVERPDKPIVRYFPGLGQHANHFQVRTNRVKRFPYWSCSLDEYLGISSLSRMTHEYSQLFLPNIQCTFWATFTWR